MNNKDTNNIFSKIIVSSVFGDRSVGTSHLLHSLIAEHNFKGFITDVSTINKFKLSNSNIICAYNFPFSGCSSEQTLTFLSKEANQKNLKNIKNFIVSLDAYDVYYENYENLDQFLQKLSNIKEKNIYVAFSYCWIKQKFHLSKILTQLEKYGNLQPVIIKTSGTQAEFQDLSDDIDGATVRPIVYCGPLSLPREALNKDKIGIYSSIIVPSDVAVKLIKHI